MLKSKKATDEWAAWYLTVKAKRDELSEADSRLSEAKKDRDSSRHALIFHAHKAGHMTPGPIREQPSSEDIHALLAQLQHLASARPKESTTEEAQAYLKNLQHADHRLKQDEKALKTANELRDEHAQSLAKLEEKRPKATASTLDTIKKDLDDAQTNRDEIAAMVNRLERDDGTLATAVEAADAAQEKVEELEALASIGYGDEAETKAATAQQATARTQAEKAQAEARRQQALQRGLQRKLAEADEELSHVQTAYNAAAVQVHGDKLADLETKLVEHLTGKAITGLLEEIAQHHSALEQAQPGTSYGAARVQVSLPHLYFHPSHAELSGERRTIQAT